MKEYKLFMPSTLGKVALLNRIVMAPMTRCRAIDNIPNELMAKYYAQRSQAGLIITEGTSPSPDGLGYARTPGIFKQQQVEGWRKVTNAVHRNGGKIFVQLRHCGRLSHSFNMGMGTQILAPTALKAAGQIWTDAHQLQDFTVPREMAVEDIHTTKASFVTAAKNAIAAGFDGVELHGANGYLLEEFLSPATNIRKDNYGGSIANRCRFVIEVASAVTDTIGKEKTGIRLSPYGVAGDMSHYPQIDDTYDYLSKQLNNLGLVYIHIAGPFAIGVPAVPLSVKKMIRQNFKNTIILCGSYTKELAEADINSGLADLVAFGRPFINNPDLVERLKNNFPLSKKLHTDLFYTDDEEGYTDYTAYKALSSIY